MRQILYYFWQLCLLRTGPDKMPQGGFPLSMTFAVYATTALVSLAAGSENLGFFRLIATVFVGVAVEALIVISLLTFKGVRSRFPQTMSALFGTNTIVLVAMLPINGLFLDLDQPTIRVLAQTIFLASFVWWLTIAGYILHKSSHVSLLQGIAIAFGSEMLALTATVSLFPANS